MALSVRDAQIRRGMRAERREHPWASQKVALKIAMDHIGSHPFMYRKKR